MSICVHIVAPDGTRYERIFADGATPDQITGALRRPDVARTFGFSGTVVKKDAAFGESVPHADTASLPVIEHPDTVVCIGAVDGTGQFRETKRLAGPPAAEHPKAAPKDEPQTPAEQKCAVPGCGGVAADFVYIGPDVTVPVCAEHRGAQSEAPADRVERLDDSGVDIGPLNTPTDGK